MAKTRIIWKFRLLRKSGKLGHLWQEVHVDYILECVITSVKKCTSVRLSDSLVAFHRVPFHCPQPVLQFPTDATNNLFSNFSACRDIPESVR